jgi:tetraacyldisaccharide 4'-kinase
MAHAPAFWFRDGWIARLLSPLSPIGAAMTARRVARPGWRAPVPVICCGNVTVGGAGKTTVVLDLARRLSERGCAVHVLLRGYGGRSRGTRRVAAGDSAAEVGDEALLLAAVAPTWTGADRAASARAAVAAGARVLLMDDGLQNPTLRKDVSLLIVDGATGFGNGRVLPAGPLREPVAAGVARCQAAVVIGPAVALPPGLPVLRASLVQGAEMAGLVGKRVLAFAGIAYPDKFFAPLAAAGLDLVGRRAFPDHHPYTPRELTDLLAEADRLGATPVTTPKDAVRLPEAVRHRVQVVGVGLKWDDEAALTALLDAAVGHGHTGAAEKGTSI